MLAQVYEEPGKITLREVQTPRPASGEILVKVEVAAICGSDVSYYMGKSPLETPTGEGPLILGHEISGTVAEIGADVKSVAVGQKVALNPVQECLECENCQNGHVNLCEKGKVLGVGVNGGFAEYVVVRASNAVVVPVDCDFKTAALIEPLACSMNAIRQANIQLGDYTVIIGSGAIGLMLSQLAKAQGAKVIVVGIVDYQLELAKELGADCVFNTLDKSSANYTDDIKASISNVTGGIMAERVLVPTAAKQAVQQALEISSNEATIVYFGLGGPDDKIEIPTLETLLRNKTIKFSWRARFTFPQAMRALEHNKVNLEKLITHTYPIEQLEDALKFMSEPSGNKLKCVITL